MRLSVLVSSLTLLLGNFQHHECKSILSPGRGHSANSLDIPPHTPPIPLRLGKERFMQQLVPLGQERFMRLRRAGQWSPVSSDPPSSHGALQWLLQDNGWFWSSYDRKTEDRNPNSTEGEGRRRTATPTPRRGKRSKDPPISLDLTFHLLREVLEMKRAEKVADQATNNRRMMDIFG